MRYQKAGKVKPTQIEHKKEDKNTTAIATKDNNEVFLTEEESYLNLAYDDCLWIVDSSDAFPITRYEHFFSSYQDNDSSKIKMGNQVSRKIVKIGQVIVITNIESKLM